jgi:tetratricopeptide (TPR) repeat protein
MRGTTGARRALSGMWVLLGLLLAAPAGAAGPYELWRFDFDKAVRAGDAAQQDALVDQQPLFARSWFYGYVFDLVTEGVPEADRARARPVLDRIAGRLAQAEPPDPNPALFLDRAATGQLKEVADKARLLQDQMVDLVRSGDEDTPMVVAMELGATADAVFFGLVFRSELAARRETEKRLILRTATRVAEGRALGMDDLQPWRTLMAYHGGSVPPLDEAVVEGQVSAALNALASGDVKAARAGMTTALATSRAARGGSIRTVLILNGTANLAARDGDGARARAIRVGVLQSVRPLEKPATIAAISAQVVSDHFVDQRFAEMIAYTRELRSAVDSAAPRALRILSRAGGHLAEEGARLAAAGELAPSVRAYTEAASIWAALKPQPVVARGTPSAQVPTEVANRSRAHADALSRLAEVESRQGRFAEARAAEAEALSIYETALGDTPTAALRSTSIARSALPSGDLDAALEGTASAQQRLGVSLPVQRARNFELQGWIRLRRGERSQALSNANFALEVLKRNNHSDAELELRTSLHRLAASALEALGHPDHARARLEYAKGLKDELQTRRMLAQLALSSGDAEAAVAAWGEIPADAPGAAAAMVDRGCTRVAAGDPDGGIADLGAVRTMGLPHQQLVQAAGRTCLAAAHLAKGSPSAAGSALAQARAIVLDQPAPALVWRVHALDGLIAAGKRRPTDAAAAFARAIDAWEADRAGGVGAQTLDIRTFSLPSDVEALAEAGRDAHLAAAPRDRKNRDAHQLRALAWAMWGRQMRAGGATVGWPRVGVDLSADLDRQLRAAVAARQGALDVLADGSVRGPERVAAVEALRAGVQSAQETARTLRVSHPTWAALAAPRPLPDAAWTPPEGEIRMYYDVGDTGGRVWTLQAGVPPRVDSLVSREKLAATVEAALAVIRTPPEAWESGRRRPKDPNARAWRSLAAPIRALAPALRDRKLRAALEGKTLRIVADGPLLRFPFSALVLGTPGRKEVGNAPNFLGTAARVQHAVLPGVAPIAGAAPAEGALLVGPAESAAPCPDAGSEGVDLCGAASLDDGSAIAAVGPAKQLTGPQATDAAVTGGLAQHALVHVVAPLDTADGAFLLTSGAGDGRMAAASWGEAAPGGTTVGASIVGGPPSATETGDGVRALVSGLRRAGVAAFYFLAHRVAGTEDAVAAAELVGRMTGAADRVAALHEWQRARATQSVDPTNGGPATHHPYHWARWIAVTP